MIKNRTMSSAGFGTHITPLVAAVLATEGDVYEFGSGDYSTPVLHEIIMHQNKWGRYRTLWTFDNDINWLRNYKDLDVPGKHHVELIPDSDWDYVDVLECGVVFIDHAPAERRKVDIDRFKDAAQIIVVHDTEKSHYYRYELVLSKFRYRYEYERYSKKTTLVSNFIDVSKLFIHE